MQCVTQVHSIEDFTKSCPSMTEVTAFFVCLGGVVPVPGVIGESSKLATAVVAAEPMGERK